MTTTKKPSNHLTLSFVSNDLKKIKSQCTLQFTAHAKYEIQFNKFVKKSVGIVQQKVFICKERERERENSEEKTTPIKAKKLKQSLF